MLYFPYLLSRLSAPRSLFAPPEWDGGKECLVPTGHRLPAQGATLGLGWRKGMRSEGTPHRPGAGRWGDERRRSFRTRESAGPCSQGVLPWAGMRGPVGAEITGPVAAGITLILLCRNHSPIFSSTRSGASPTNRPGRWRQCPNGTSHTSPGCNPGTAELQTPTFTCTQRQEWRLAN